MEYTKRNLPILLVSLGAVLLAGLGAVVAVLMGIENTSLRSEVASLESANSSCWTAIGMLDSANQSFIGTWEAMETLDLDGIREHAMDARTSMDASLQHIKACQGGVKAIPK